jgi:hypothetical protein
VLFVLLEALWIFSVLLALYPELSCYHAMPKNLISLYLWQSLSCSVSVS